MGKTIASGKVYKYWRNNIMANYNESIELGESFFNDNPQLRDRLRFSHRDDWESFILDDA